MYCLVVNNLFFGIKKFSLSKRICGNLVMNGCLSGMISNPIKGSRCFHKQENLHKYTCLFSHANWNKLIKSKPLKATSYSLLAIYQTTSIPESQSSQLLPCIHRVCISKNLGHRTIG